ncbi:hypothetical protein GIB67_018470 [Kingdonia uniflora]|uniref:Glucose-methanol-choline oxidoreductase C-terminal domain-containing protein n=1 Tax=Kingdonia uniflora TaxID=39325 RepID=A0A7J7LJM1_9MAGN|nr:hypothetical protein GIB67_018470 [Kingdonia uniflora]
MLKIFCFFFYLSRTNGDSRNLASDAMEYQLKKENPIKTKKERPLQKGIVKTLYESDTTLVNSLAEKAKKALQILVAVGATEVGIHKSDGQRMKSKGVKEKKLEDFLDIVIPYGGQKPNGELWNIYCFAHQMGSCRMGATEEDGAPNENGVSWEVEGLYVCDSSILPSAIGVSKMVLIDASFYTEGTVKFSTLPRVLAYAGAAGDSPPPDGARGRNCIMKDIGTLGDISSGKTVVWYKSLTCFE